MIILILAYFDAGTASVLLLALSVSCYCDAPEINTEIFDKKKSAREESEIELQRLWWKILIWNALDAFALRQTDEQRSDTDRQSYLRTKRPKRTDRPVQERKKSYTAGRPYQEKNAFEDKSLQWKATYCIWHIWSILSGSLKVFVIGNINCSLR